MEAYDVIPTYSIEPQSLLLFIKDAYISDYKPAINLVRGKMTSYFRF